MSDWKAYLINKVESKRSPLTFVASDDKVRFVELMVLLKKRYNEVYVFDGWRGLLSFSGEKFEPVEVDEMSDITHILYRHLQQEKTAIVLKNWDEGYFLRFLLWVSGDFTIFKQESAMFVLVDNVGQVPADLRERVNIVDILTTYTDRETLLSAQFKRLNLKHDPKEVARILSGLNLDQTEACIVGSYVLHKDIDMRYVQRAKKEFIARRGNLTLLESPFGFEGVGGYAYIKQFLKQYVITPIRHPKEAEQMGVELPKGILLYGIEGTGKTLTAKALGKELNMPVVQFHSSQYRSKYFGETEQRVKTAIKAVQEMSPCVVFIDEIEHLGYRPSGETDSGTSQNVFTMLLSFMSEGHGSIVLGTTNKIERLDEAFMRAGRIDYYIPQMLPDAEARRQIWDVHTKVVRTVPLAKDVDLDDIVKRTEWWNGAEIELLVRTASTIALCDSVDKKQKKPKVKMEHILQAFQERKVDVQDRITRSKNHQKISQRICPQSIVQQAFGMLAKKDEAELSEVMKDYVGGA